MARRPIVLVHGYSDQGDSFARWRELLAAAGYDATTVHVGSYVSLSNEISIKDIAEGFDRALRHAGFGPEVEFDAFVHSTGMLVIREWLAGTIGSIDRPEIAVERQARLKHLIALAPATYGSPMAHKGRSWLGAVFKGGKSPGPDFMEAGDMVLRGLELGSAYTWDLAHRDFLADPPVYGRSAATPYPFIFVGLKDYGWLKRAVTEPGTDGTVRWAGVGFNSRKIRIDLTAEPTRRKRVHIEPWRNTTVPQVLVPDLNHSSILREPTPALVQMVLAALQVNSAAAYTAWSDQHQAGNARAVTKAKARPWQQFVVHAIDERGDGITDFFLELGTVKDGSFVEVRNFDMDVHAYKEDESYRAFHVDLSKLDDVRAGQKGPLAIRVIASSGTELVGYHGFSSDRIVMPPREQNKWDAVLEFDATIGTKEVAFFYPFTTTLIELRMNREPMPLEGVNKVFWFSA